MGRAIAGTVNDVDVSGAATNSAGTVVGSGDSQDISSRNNLPPGTVAFGMIYIHHERPCRKQSLGPQPDL